MKKLLFGLIATVLFSSASLAQDAEIVSGKINANTTSVDIPSELKSDLNYKTNSEEFITHKHYYVAIKGDITIITDSKNQIVAVTLPVGTSEEKVRGIVKCFKNAFWGDGGGWSGFWDCVVN